MTSIDERIRRFQLWNRLFIGLLIISVITIAGKTEINGLQTQIYALHVTWHSDGDISFSSTSDGPFVVTHPVNNWNVEADTLVVQLPRSFAIIDSHGAVCSKSQVSRLVWMNIYGQVVASPKAGSDIKALYYRPEMATKSEPQP